MNKKIKLGIVAGNVGLLMVAIAFVAVWKGWQGATSLGIAGLAVYALVWFNIIQPYKYSRLRANSEEQ